MVPPALLLHPAGPAALSPLATLLYYTQNHAEENLYHCALCGEGFAPRNNLKRRMNSHAGNNSNHCALCSENFVNWNWLKFHIKYICWRKSVPLFSSSSSRNQQTRQLKVHVRKITYHCAISRSKFQFSNPLKKHINNHHGDKR